MPAAVVVEAAAALLAAEMAAAEAVVPVKPERLNCVSFEKIIR